MLKHLSSKSLSIWLFLGICPLLAASTFFPISKPYINPAVYSLLGFLNLSLIACTLYNWQRLSQAVILIHAGCIIASCGGVVSATGYVATVNIYKGDSTASVYRWDVKKDIDLAVNLNVKNIRHEYYPVEIKIGVLINGTPQTLIQT